MTRRLFYENMGLCVKIVRIVQLVRTSDLHSEGRRFESCSAHQNRENAKRYGKASVRKNAKGMDRDKLNALSKRVIGIAIEVHKELKAGFNEKIYQNALAEELSAKDIKFEKEKPIAAYYKNKNVGEQRIDFIIEDELIIEIKSTDSISGIHIAQILSYLKTLNKRLGLILNFAQPKLGIKRVANNL